MAGQVIRRGDRKYQVRISLGYDADGKRKYFTKTINGTKKEAEAYRNLMIYQINTGNFTELSKEYFRDFITEWLSTIAKSTVSDKTYRGYEQSVRLYLIPALGKIPIDRIKPEQIQKLYHDLEERGLSPSTIKNAHAVLRSSLNKAVKWGKLNRNPSTLTVLPRKKKQEITVLNGEEAKRFLEASIYNRMKPLFSLLLTSGMRPGEALALKWSDVNFENKRITINKSLSRVSGKWTLKEPKTSHGRRTVPIPEQVVDDLREHKLHQNAEKQKKGKADYHDQDFVFATNSGEPFSDRNIIKQYFKPLLKSAGLPDIRLYDLRHTCATLLLSAGVNPKIVSERLGHSGISITLNTYSHVLPNMQESAAKKLEDILF